MEQTKASKRYLFMGILFGILAIFFALMYYFNVIQTLDLLLSVVYVMYFAGLALVYNGAYCKTHQYKVGFTLSLIAGIMLIVASVVLLIYGLSTGQISLINI